MAVAGRPHRAPGVAALVALDRGAVRGGHILLTGWSLASDVRHGEIADVVSHNDGSVDARCPGNQGIRSVDGSTASLEIGLVAARSARGFAGGLQELQPIQERRCSLAFL